MFPSSIVFFVLFIASTFNIQCDSFSTQTHISRVAVKSFTAISRSNQITMTSTESVSDQVQLGRVTMYKKEGQSISHSYCWGSLDYTLCFNMLESTCSLQINLPRTFFQSFILSSLNCCDNEAMKYVHERLIKPFISSHCATNCTHHHTQTRIHLTRAFLTIPTVPHTNRRTYINCLTSSCSWLLATLQY